MKKLVEREHLHYVESELHFLKLYIPESLKDRFNALLDYFNRNIIQKDKDSKNEFKRVVYERMKEAKTAEENKLWYKFYKSLDDLYKCE